MVVVDKHHRRVRRAVAASGDSTAEATVREADAADAAIEAARSGAAALQRDLLDGELAACETLGRLLGQAERRHADAAEAGRQHFVTFFGTARPSPVGVRSCRAVL